MTQFHFFSNVSYGSVDARVPSSNETTCVDVHVEKSNGESTATTSCGNDITNNNMKSCDGKKVNKFVLASLSQ